MIIVGKYVTPQIYADVIDGSEKTFHKLFEIANDDYKPLEVLGAALDQARRGALGAKWDHTKFKRVVLNYLDEKQPIYEQALAEWKPGPPLTRALDRTNDCARAFAEVLPVGTNASIAFNASMGVYLLAGVATGSSFSTFRIACEKTIDRMADRYTKDLDEHLAELVKPR